MGDSPPPTYTDQPAVLKPEAAPPQPQPAAPPVVYQSTAAQRTYPHYQHRTAKALGITLIVVAVVLLFLQTFAFLLRAAAAVSGAGAAVFGAIMSIIAGAFCIAASKRHTQCYVISAMVLAIISAVVISGAPLAHIGGVIWDADSESCRDKYDGDWEDECGPFNDSIIIGSCMIFFGTVDLAVAIWAAVLGCRVCCSGRTSVDPVVQHHVIITSNQPAGAAQPGYYTQQPMHAASAPAAYPALGPATSHDGQALGHVDAYPTKQY